MKTFSSDHIALLSGCGLKVYGSSEFQNGLLVKFLLFPQPFLDRHIERRP